jgi:hypothetical protein
MPCRASASCATIVLLPHCRAPLMRTTRVSASASFTLRSAWRGRMRPIGERGMAAMVSLCTCVKVWSLV